MVVGCIVDVNRRGVVRRSGCSWRHATGIVPGNKDVLDHRRYCCRALSNHYVPVVFDVVVAERNQEAAEVDRAAVMTGPPTDVNPAWSSRKDQCRPLTR